MTSMKIIGAAQPAGKMDAGRSSASEHSVASLKMAGMPRSDVGSPVLRLQTIANQSPQTQRLMQMAEMVRSYPSVRQMKSPSIVQRVVGERPEGEFQPTLPWAKWFSAMTEEERAANYEAVGVKPDSAVIGLMNDILRRHALPVLSDKLRKESRESGVTFRDEVPPETDAAEHGAADATEHREGGAADHDIYETKEEAAPTQAPATTADDAEARHVKRITIVALRISKDKKKYQLALLNACDKETEKVMASVTKASGESATIAKAMGILAFATGTHSTGAQPHPVFVHEYNNFVKKSAAQRDVETLVPVADNSGVPHVPQKELFNRLDAAMKLAKGDGHHSVKMAKVPLKATFQYKVYGQVHVVSHLYLQKGNDQEIRCYLGTMEGAFQRIHTSLTVQGNDTPTAHTMVQTGPTLVVPGYHTKNEHKGERVGFDSTESPANPGIANRALTGRSKKQCTVDGYLEGKSLEELGAGKVQAEQMARAFNTTLDQIAKDIRAGNFKEEMITRTPDFLPLDEGVPKKAAAATDSTSSSS